MTYAAHLAVATTAWCEKQSTGRKALVQEALCPNTPTTKHQPEAIKPRSVEHIPWISHIHSVSATPLLYTAWSDKYNTNQVICISHPPGHLYTHPPGHLYITPTRSYVYHTHQVICISHPPGHLYITPARSSVYHTHQVIYITHPPGHLSITPTRSSI